MKFKRQMKSESEAETFLFKPSYYTLNGQQVNYIKLYENTI